MAALFIFSLLPLQLLRRSQALKFVFQDKVSQDLLDGSLVFLHEPFFVDSLNRAVLGAKLMD
jgi:hypothetical protein